MNLQAKDMGQRQSIEQILEDVTLPPRNVSLNPAPGLSI